MMIKKGISINVPVPDIFKEPKDKADLSTYKIIEIDEKTKTVTFIDEKQNLL